MKRRTDPFSSPCLARGHLLIRSLDHLHLSHSIIPFLDERILIQTQPRNSIFRHPRIEMHIDGTKAARQDGGAITLLQLALQHVQMAIDLHGIAAQRVLVPRRVGMAVPERLTQHRSQPSQQEKRPFLEIDDGLLGGAARAESAVGVVHAEEVVHDGAGFPGEDAGVGVGEGGQSAVRVDGEEGFAFNAVDRVVAEFPEADFVGDGEDLEGDGDFVRVGRAFVGVEG